VAQDPKSFSSTHDDFNRLSVEILLSDADLALTFTEIALNHCDQNSYARTVRNARKAYDTIAAKRSEVAMSADERTELDARLAVLKSRLEKLEKRES
jgi:hypothetical protein